MGVSAKSKAPQDDAEYNEAVKQLKATISDVGDLESRASGVNSAVTKLASEAERALAATDKLSVSTTLGNTTDLAPIKRAVEAHNARWVKLQADLKALKAELNAMDAHVQERHKAGAEMQKLKGKAETLESKSDAKAAVARSEADRAEETYDRAHESSLNELKAWKSGASERYRAVHDEVVELSLALFKN